MPRAARMKSSSGIYHVIIRGINRQTIFFDNEDNETFIKILKTCKGISGFKLYGYCLMGNHMHLLIKEEKEELEKIFKRIGVRYVYWYNWKYKRTGHLFQDRFISEPVETDAYFLAALRYIHQNPQKAGLCMKLSEYNWSSYAEYLKGSALVDTDFALELISSEKFEAFMNEQSEEKMLEISDDFRLTDSELSKKIEDELMIKAIMIQNKPKKEKIDLIKKILKYEGVSSRQISRVTGLSPNVIWKIAGE
jgi:Transposase and inactivated derivatives